MTPSAGASLPSIARWEECGRPWMPSSTNVPSSIRRSSRSRAVSLSLACWASIFSGPPPSLIFSRLARRSSASGRSRLVEGASVAIFWKWNVLLPTLPGLTRNRQAEGFILQIEGRLKNNLGKRAAVHCSQGWGRARGRGWRGRLGGDLPAQESQSDGLLERLVRVDQPHAHERQQRDVDLGGPEPHPLPRDDQVTRERDAQRPRQHVAVGGADRRLAELADQP